MNKLTPTATAILVAIATHTLALLDSLEQLGKHPFESENYEQAVLSALTGLQEQIHIASNSELSTMAVVEKLKDCCQDISSLDTLNLGTLDWLLYYIRELLHGFKPISHRPPILVMTNLAFGTTGSRLSFFIASLGYLERTILALSTNDGWGQAQEKWVNGGGSSFNHISELEPAFQVVLEQRIIRHNEQIFVVFDSFINYLTTNWSNQNDLN